MLRRGQFRHYERSDGFYNYCIYNITNLKEFIAALILKSNCVLCCGSFLKPVCKNI